tara:strand:- start:1728 stop:1955 length:228 start_codon:yes stop_codon:yes gene_type:complete
MKFLLIATALNLQLVYPSEEVCNMALDELKEQDPKAICIPAPEQSVDRANQMFESFIQMIKKLEETNQKNLTNKD